MHCHAHPGNKTKHQKTKKQKPNKKHQTQKQHKHTKPETNNQKQHTPMSSDVTSTSLWVKKIDSRGDSLVSSRCMHNDILCAMMTLALNKKHRTRNATKTPGANSEGVGSNTAQCRDPASQDPRDHKEQPSRHDLQTQIFVRTANLTFDSDNIRVNCFSPKKKGFQTNENCQRLQIKRTTTMAAFFLRCQNAQTALCNQVA